AGPGPDSNPDFLGQLGLSLRDDGRPVLWVSRIYRGALDWDLVTSQTEAALPDNVVMEDSDNNFTDYNQRIQGAQIASVTTGNHDPEHEPIRGNGHIYLKNNDYTPEVYIAHETTGGLKWMRFADHQFLDTVVYRDMSNDFTDVNQTISGSPIASISSSILDPVASGIDPGRPGEIWVQLGKATDNKLPRMWISKEMNVPGVSHWEEITAGTSGIPANVLLTDRKNNFTEPTQEIRGKQIMSFVDGGDKTPAQSGLGADYDGQFYIAVRGEDPAIWIAKGNKWIPLLANVVMENRINRFVPLQEMGTGNRVVRLTGASQGTVNPLSVSLVPLTDGEIYVQTIEHPHGGFDRHVYVAGEGGDTTSWIKIYDDRNDTIVRTDETNHFINKVQYLGIESDTAKEMVMGARYYGDKEGSDSPNNYTPQRTGEIMVLKEEEQGEMFWVTYMGIVDGKKKAWTELSHVLIP
ncbi:MAG: hypothetical protein ACRC9Y_03220, partial [Aeromonas veronii]